jgi:hypothetical protein
VRSNWTSLWINKATQRKRKKKWNQFPHLPSTNFFRSLSIRAELIYCCALHDPVYTTLFISFQKWIGRSTSLASHIFFSRHIFLEEKWGWKCEESYLFNEKTRRKEVLYWIRTECRASRHLHMRANPIYVLQTTPLKRAETVGIQLEQSYIVRRRIKDIAIGFYYREEENVIYDTSDTMIHSTCAYTHPTTSAATALEFDRLPFSLYTNKWHCYCCFSSSFVFLVVRNNNNNKKGRDRFALG